MKFTGKTEEINIGGQTFKLRATVGSMFKLKDKFGMKLSDWEEMGRQEDEIESLRFVIKFIWGCLFIEDGTGPTYEEIVNNTPLDMDILGEYIRVIESVMGDVGKND